MYHVEESVSDPLKCIYYWWGSIAESI